MTVTSGDVLVVHPNAGRRAVLASAIPSHRVIAVGSKQEATRRMADLMPLLIIAPPDDARGFLRQVDASAPNALRVFVCSQADAAGLEELMQSAAEGHVFSILDDTLSGPELGRAITHLLHHRGSAISVPPSSFLAHFQVQGRSVTARCLEIGNFGATLEVSGEVPLIGFLPGTALEALCIEREGQVVLRVAWAHVQQARPMRDAQSALLRLGISWGTTMHHPPLVPPVSVSVPEDVLSILRKAIRREVSLWLQMAHEPAMQLRLDSPALRVGEDGRACLLGRGSELLVGREGDVVRLSFEMGGQSYSGTGSVLGHSPEGQVMLRVPHSLSMRNWRSLPRFRTGPQQSFLVSFHSPITGQRATRSVLDLSYGGLSFPFDASCELLPPGSLLDASLMLPDGTSVECPLEIRSIQMMPSQVSGDGGLRPFRAGARMLTIPEQGREAIINAFISSRTPSAVDASRLPFEDIWKLMAEARYVFHPDYTFEDAGVLALLADTHQKLYASGELGRSVVYREGEELRGHAAALRIHSRSWLIQHLAVRPGFRRNEPVARELIALLIELGELLEDVEFIRYSWRRDNRWPNRLGSWLARAMDGQGLSVLRHFNYMRLPLSSEPAPLPEGLLPVRDSSRTDHTWLEAHLRGRGEVVRVLAEDLRADAVELGELGARFQAAGLYRHRRLFIVDGEEEPLAVALSEEGSPGLNLIETSNAFWLVIPDRTHPDAPRAVRSLIHRCIVHARERGRPSAIGMVDDSDVSVLLEMGFEDLGRFAEWIFHRSMIRRWCELWRSLFERHGKSNAALGPGEEG